MLRSSATVTGLIHVPETVTQVLPGFPKTFVLSPRTIFYFKFRDTRVVATSSSLFWNRSKFLPGVFYTLWGWRSFTTSLEAQVERKKKKQCQPTKSMVHFYKYSTCPHNGAVAPMCDSLSYLSHVHGWPRASKMKQASCLYFLVMLSSSLFYELAHLSAERY